MLDQEKGILKVFLSFPLRDIKGSKEKPLNRLLSTFESTALELFISKGDGSQKTLEEVRTCDIAIFLISPYCETRISHCEFTETCKAECEIKRGEGKISYSWCEFRIALSENKPYLIYIIDEGCEADNNLKLWKTGESEKEYSQIGYDSVKKFMDDLARNIIEWYSEGKINLRRFCGRRDLLKKLFNKMNKSVEVYGVGGIGKTTLCEAALLIYTLLGREVFYIGGEEGYASGSGYEYGSQIVRHHFPDVTIDDILDVLNFAEDFKKVDEKMKINAILNFLEREDAILYIDNLRENETLKELVRRGNGLRRGCILVSLKRELSIAFYRLPVESIEREERDSLVELMESRMGKVIEKREKMRIAEIGEGHPIATYLLVSNLGRGNIVDLESFKEGLDFSRDDDVREYMDRVVRSSISSEAYNLLKDLSIIEEEIDMKSINRKAIKAFEEVLRVCPLEDFPFGYAETQNDLGKVYTKLSKVEDTTKNSRKAIIAYKEALKVFKKEQYPERYHSIKENLFEAIS